MCGKTILHRHQPCAGVCACPNSCRQPALLTCLPGGRRPYYVPAPPWGRCFDWQTPRDRGRSHLVDSSSARTAVEACLVLLVCLYSLTRCTHVPTLDKLVSWPNGLEHAWVDDGQGSSSANVAAWSTRSVFRSAFCWSELALETRSELVAVWLPRVIIRLVRLIALRIAR